MLLLFCLRSQSRTSLSPAVKRVYSRKFDYIRQVFPPFVLHSTCSTDISVSWLPVQWGRSKPLLVRGRRAFSVILIIYKSVLEYRFVWLYHTIYLLIRVPNSLSGCLCVYNSSDNDTLYIHSSIRTYTKHVLCTYMNGCICLYWEVVALNSVQVFGLEGNGQLMLVGGVRSIQFTQYNC